MSKLQDLRKNKGYSQSELAEQSGVKKRVLQNYEQGVLNLDGAGLDKLLPLAIALNCKISDLLEDENLINMCHTLGI